MSLNNFRGRRNSNAAVVGVLAATLAAIPPNGKAVIPTNGPVVPNAPGLTHNSVTLPTAPTQPAPERPTQVQIRAIGTKALGVVGIPKAVKVTSTEKRQKNGIPVSKSRKGDSDGTTLAIFQHPSSHTKKIAKPQEDEPQESGNLENQQEIPSRRANLNKVNTTRHMVAGRPIRSLNRYLADEGFFKLTGKHEWREALLEKLIAKGFMLINSDKSSPYWLVSGDILEKYLKGIEPKSKKETSLTDQDLRDMKIIQIFVRRIKLRNQNTKNETDNRIRKERAEAISFDTGLSIDEALEADEHEASLRELYGEDWDTISDETNLGFHDYVDELGELEKLYAQEILDGAEILKSQGRFDDESNSDYTQAHPGVMTAAE